MIDKDNIKLIVVDLFSGAGGTTTGFEDSNVAKVIACINHDKKAIESHKLNHPDCEHFIEDILVIDLNKLKKVIEKAKAIYKNAKLVIWASLECTNFSNAKNGPRDADSRTLAYGLYRYLDFFSPDYLMIENVREFMAWGELDENNKPLKRKNGTYFVKWREKICDRYGYHDEWRLLDSADYGAYTSRLRLFGIFAKHGLKISFPKATYSETGMGKDLFDSFQKHKAVKDVLDLENEGVSIFKRKKPLVDNTIKRIIAGIKRFVAPKIKEDFILKYNSMDSYGNGFHTVINTDFPCPTVTCQHRIGYAKVDFIQQYFGAKKGNERVMSIENPIGTITTIDHHSKVTALLQYNGSETQLKSLENPCPTITTVDRFAVVNFIDNQYGNGYSSSIENPCPTITNSCKQSLTSSFIFNPAYGGNMRNIDKPCFVIVARQDKAPLYLLSYNHESNFFLPIYDDDSEIMIELKKLMIQYGISDIKTRMLTVEEKLLIQGFPRNYKLVGNQDDKGKFIGNAVVPLIPKEMAKEIAKFL